jgi:hypothetical protein
MSRTDVIALQEAFNDNLPVGRRLLFGGCEQLLAGRNKLREFRQARLYQIRLVLRDEHQAAHLCGLHRRQSPRGLVEAGEPILVRHVTETTIEAVGPAVIATDKSFLAARSVSQLRAAMAAGIAEGPDPPVTSSHGEDRRACRVARDIRPGLAQRCGRTEWRRVSAQYQFKLSREPYRR